MSAAPIPQGSHALAELRDLTECRCPADYKNRGRVACDCLHAYREDVEALAAALAASEARATRLQALLDERIELTGAAIIRAEATEQSLAEARALLRDEAALLRAWARESRDGGWSTHQVDPMNRRAAAIDALLPKGEGETS